MVIKKAQGNRLYTGGGGELDKLSKGSIAGVSYTVKVTGNNGTNSQLYLGGIRVDWKATKLPLPEEMSGSTDEFTHGPLALSHSSTIRFLGPPCNIEQTPFEASLTLLPAAARVATPFDVNYTVKNKTSVHQSLTVSMNEGGMLVSGLVKGEMHLGPMESKVLKYTALATKAGRVALPALHVSSHRHNAWVIKGNQERFLFVMP